MQNLLKDKLGPKTNIFILQLSVITVLILALTAVRFIGGDIYTDIKNWYILYFGSDTDISEVIGSDDDGEDAVQQSGISSASSGEKPELMSVSAVKTVHAVIGGSKAENASAVSNSLCKPIENATVSSAFGDRENPVTFLSERHKGLDLSAPSGTPIYAAASGTVVFSGSSPTYGNYILIDHGQGLQTLYAHCSKLMKQKNEQVYKGEKIALVGSTGQSTGPHLHFEVRLNGNYINPQWLINW